MREIGGYFELETFSDGQYHKGALALNYGRGCYAYLIELRNIKKIWIPDYMCNSVENVFKRNGVEINKYCINSLFLPEYDFEVRDDEWMMINDYYGQLSDEDIAYAYNFSNQHLIFDETQGFLINQVLG